MSGGKLGGGIDFDVALDAFMAGDSREIDAIDNFLKSWKKSENPRHHRLGLNSRPNRFIRKAPGEKSTQNMDLL